MVSETLTTFSIGAGPRVSIMGGGDYTAAWLTGINHAGANRPRQPGGGDSGERQGSPMSLPQGAAVRNAYPMRGTHGDAAQGHRSDRGGSVRDRGGPEPDDIPDPGGEGPRGRGDGRACRSCSRRGPRAAPSGCGREG